MGAGVLTFAFACLLNRAVAANYLHVSASFTTQVSQLGILTGGVLLLIGLLYLTRPDRVVRRLGDWLGQARRARWLIVMSVLAYVLIFGWMVVQRHVRFNSAGYDLGIQDQVVWSTSRGYLYHTSVEVENYLGDHFQPLMAVLSPLYWLVPSVYWLLAFQTTVLALGAIPLFHLARRRFESTVAGLVFASVYLLYPAVGYINRFDFHWEATVIPLLLAAATLVDEARLGWASLCLALALFGKEEIGLTVAAFGLVTALRGRLKFGVIWGVVGMVFSVVALFVLIPLFRTVPSDTLNRYAWLGSNPVEMLTTLLTRPRLLLQKGVLSDGLFLGFQLFAPVAFLSLLGPEYMVVALPSIGYNLLSSFPPQHTAHYQYVAPTVPFVLIGAIEGMARLQRWLARRVRVPYVGWGIWMGLLIFAARAAVVDSPLVDAGIVPPAWTRLTNEAAVRAALTRVPPQASVFTTNHYAPHLSQRYVLHVFAYPGDVERLGAVDVAFFNLRDHRSVISSLSCDGGLAAWKG
jgi:uncharacterized membrane protein